MKHIQLLSIISVWLIILSQNINAQVNLVNGSKFLKIQFLNQAPPNDKFALIDTLLIVKQNVDTIDFLLTNSRAKFKKINKKTYLIKDSDTILLYDYDLAPNDNFFLKKSNGQMDSFVVDSVNYKKLNDNKNYKHWYLRNKSNDLKITWLENLGEKNIGWDYSNYDLFDFNSALKAICINESLIYWNNGYNGLEQHQIADTCNFNGIQKLLFISSTNYKSLVIYPNPANNFITIDYPKINSIDWEISILDINGKMVFESKEPLTQIPTSNLPNDTYLLQLNNKTYQLHETHPIIIHH
jgi:hypothetical protein